MAKRSSKKLEKQLDLPASQPALRILPSQLRVEDRRADETGEWEVATRPHTTAGGKTVHVRVQRLGEPATAAERDFGAHERVSVKRVGKGKEYRLAVF